MERGNRVLKRWMNALLLGVASLLVAIDSDISQAQIDSTWSFELRLRQQVDAEGGRFNAVYTDELWDANKTAIIVCDMWNLHHCLNATRRGAEMAPRMNRFIKKARSRGAVIIHAPSSCMEAYQGHPARLHAVDTPRSESLPEEIGSWCHQIPSEEQGEYPIDQSDGGEDDDPMEHVQWAKNLEAMGLDPRKPWSSQTDKLDIESEDYISDKGDEIWSILEQQGRTHVLLVGVHTNMCVLGRPFGLRQMAKNGKRVALVRDLTDTMYNPLRAPFVSHFTGTDLIVEHIEKWICPTITSDQVLGGRPFVFESDQRPRLVIVMAEQEYDTHATLPRFAIDKLGKTFQVELVHASQDKPNDLPGIEQALRRADLLLVSVRRRAFKEKQLRAIRNFVESGKPVVGIRTASHAFSLRGKPAPEGHALWESFDQDVFGGNYSNHYGNKLKVVASVATDAESHPILAGVGSEPFAVYGSLYKVSPLASSAIPLLVGSVDNEEPEPVAWVNVNRFGGRTFYTSLGHPEDFEQSQFLQLLSNSLHWAAAH